MSANKWFGSTIFKLFVFLGLVLELKVRQIVKDVLSIPINTYVVTYGTVSLSINVATVAFLLNQNGRNVLGSDARLVSSR